ncbi:hypothetical protein [Salarchaeum sp. JOR-1]|uniref:hypothetical protein n=1 Tax=Salarchaeum sp. JOR-1 TaxID=2599399 RepID=UPI001198734F|nr:hypothetical protein [Salarchaeum sp. JOR-1]QDX39632.1 hypothetical protein FQU85_01510 [Salarchaeum sp. JOR-1]
MVNQQVLSGGALLAVGILLILWTGINWNSGAVSLGLAAVSSMLLAGGSLLIGTSEDGRSV